LTSIFLSRIGYARVSTNDQDTALQKAECSRIYQDTASGRVVLEGVPTPEAAEALAEQVHRHRLQHGYQRV